MEEMKGSYGLAKEYYLKAVKQAEIEKGKESHDYANSLNNLILLYELLDEDENLESLYEEMLHAIKSAEGERGLNYAMSLYNFGFYYVNRNQYELAEEYTNQALKIYEEGDTGIAHYSYAIVLAGLGKIYMKTERYEESLNVYEEALRVEGELLGKEQPSYSYLLNDIGSIYAKLGMYKKAKEVYQKGAELDLILYGENHENYRTSLNNLAEMTWRGGDYKTAEQLYLDILELEKTLEK